MKIRFIINPIAGNGKQKDITKNISFHMNNYELFYTKKQGDARKISKDAVKQKVDTVIVVGGDGTVNECVKSLKNTNTALGVIPCGSGNGFAYHIGMNKNIIKSIKQLEKAKVEIVDTCSVNGIEFLNVSGIGFDAHIANLFSKVRKRGFLTYLKLIFKEINYKPKQYQIEYGSINKKTKAFMISFANASQYGNNAQISPNADIKDGLIDFVIVKEFPKWMIPFFLIKIVMGRIHLSKYTEIIRTNKMKIITKQSLIHVDGEPYHVKSPVSIKLFEKSLKILIPNG